MHFAIQNDFPSNMSFDRLSFRHTTEWMVVFFLQSVKIWENDSWIPIKCSAPATDPAAASLKEPDGYHRKTFGTLSAAWQDEKMRKCTLTNSFLPLRSASSQLIDTLPGTRFHYGVSSIALSNESLICTSRETLLHHSWPTWMGTYWFPLLQSGNMPDCTSNMLHILTGLGNSVDASGTA